MKKLSILFLSLLLLLSCTFVVMAGCKKDDDNTPTGTPSNTPAATSKPDDSKILSQAMPVMLNGLTGLLTDKVQAKLSLSVYQTDAAGKSTEEIAANLTVRMDKLENFSAVLKNPKQLKTALSLEAAGDITYQGVRKDFSAQYADQTIYLSMIDYEAQDLRIKLTAKTIEDLIALLAPGETGQALAALADVPGQDALSVTGAGYREENGLIYASLTLDLSGVYAAFTSDVKVSAVLDAEENLKSLSVEKVSFGDRKLNLSLEVTEADFDKVSAPQNAALYTDLDAAIAKLGTIQPQAWKDVQMELRLNDMVLNGLVIPAYDADNKFDLQSSKFDLEGEPGSASAGKGKFKATYADGSLYLAAGENYDEDSAGTSAKLKLGLTDIAALAATIQGLLPATDPSAGLEEFFNLAAGNLSVFDAVGALSSIQSIAYETILSGYYEGTHIKVLLHCPAKAFTGNDDPVYIQADMTFESDGAIQLSVGYNTTKAPDPDGSWTSTTMINAYTDNSVSISAPADADAYVDVAEVSDAVNKTISKKYFELSGSLSGVLTDKFVFFPAGYELVGWDAFSLAIEIMDDGSIRMKLDSGGLHVLTIYGNHNEVYFDGSNFYIKSYPKDYNGEEGEPLCFTITKEEFAADPGTYLMTYMLGIPDLSALASMGSMFGGGMDMSPKTDVASLLGIITGISKIAATADADAALSVSLDLSKILPILVGGKLDLTYDDVSLTGLNFGTAVYMPIGQDPEGNVMALSMDVALNLSLDSVTKPAGKDVLEGLDKKNYLSWQQQAAEFDKLVTNLGDISQLTLEDEERVAAVLEAYDALKPQAKQCVAQKAGMRAAFDRINLLKGQRILDLLSGLKPLDELTFADAEEIHICYDYYAGGDPAVRRMVGEENAAKLYAAYQKVKPLADAAVKNVNDLCAALPAKADVTEADREKIQAAKAAYDDLPDYFKSRIYASYKTKLDDALEALAALETPAAA